MAAIISLRICDTWKVNPTTYASWGLIAACHGWIHLFQLFLIAQALIFKIPIRWDDSAKGFRSTEGSSADYLNFFHSCAWLHLIKRGWCLPIIRWLCPPERILAMIRHYYRNEPHSEFIVEMSEHAIKEVFK